MKLPNFLKGLALSFPPCNDMMWLQSLGENVLIATFDFTTHLNKNRDVLDFLHFIHVAALICTSSKKNMGILKASNRQKKQNVWPLVQLSNEHNLAWKSGNPMETHKNRTTRTYYCSLFLLGWRITWVYMSHMTSKPKNSWINDSISLAAWEWIRDVFTRWAGAMGWLMKGWGRYL